ncbi:MAG: TetR/AcrR family transcriptional regulator [Chthonomonadales bacterium]
MSGSDARRRHGEIRREQILDAAVKLFAEKGYAGASIRDLAREIGVTEGLLYHYFSSKEQLLEACWKERSWRAQLERILAQAQGAPVARVLYDIVVDFLETLYEHGPSVRMCAAEMQHNPEMADQYLRNIEASQKVLTDFLRGRQDMGEISGNANLPAAAGMLMGSAFSVFLLYGRRSHEEWRRMVEDFAAAAVQILMNGLAPPHGVSNGP